MQTKELDEVRRLFQQAEAEGNPERKFTLLQSALDLADDYVDGNPDSSGLIVAGNMRRVHLHRLLAQLVEIGNVDIGIWFKYIRLFLLRIEPEVKAILASDPSLGESYRKFMDLWREELIVALQRAR